MFLEARHVAHNHAAHVDGQAGWSFSKPLGYQPQDSRHPLEQQHQIDEARLVVEQCLAIDPGDDQARYFYAVLDRRENKLEDAERHLRDLIASEPKHPYVRYA